MQRHVEIKHIDGKNEDDNLDEESTQLLIVDPLDEKPTETHLEVKIEVKRENVDPGDSSLPSVEGNETLPEGW